MPADFTVHHDHFPFRRIMKVLVTGAAGFIGMHVVQQLLARGDMVVGVDNLNDYYDVSLKEARLAQIPAGPAFTFHKLDIADRDGMANLFQQFAPEVVIHLAAQAGVRYSLKNPHVYAESNLIGFVNVLEGCRQTGVKHLVYASSSSVYGGNTKLPFAESDSVDHPVSLYAATKKANELMAHSYSHLYGLPTTGLRFFTVYGPWGRPDMAYWKFTESILAGRTIDVFNNGQMERDFTYVDDIVDGVLKVADLPPTATAGYDRSQPDPATSWAPYRVLNIGNENPVPLMDFIACLEQALGKQTPRNYLPMQDGDVVATFADTSRLKALTGSAPETPLAEGVARFVRWYQTFTA